MFKSGFITIIGEPNVGKSTFLNRVLGQKVAIVSDKPQTTRDLITGILTREHAQYIFIDTPGIHHAQTRLGEYMSSAALSTVRTVDLVLFMINAYDDVKESNLAILEQIKTTKTPVFLIVNKLDTIKDIKRLKENLEVYKAAFPFKATFAISALVGTNVDHLLDDIYEMLEEGPMFYMDGELSDKPETFLIRELIREKILTLTRDEIPHSVMIYLEKMHWVKSSKTMQIFAQVIVERDSQKSIIIGKQGSMLKQIGTLARADIEALLGSKVYLELFCKVEPDWRNREFYLKSYGYKPEQE
ncbi:MAG: GTPase Era [Candidatus Izemoplasmatales bacterium]|jgi:GTP-binding protein Era|nr:GTPase Era [bacterium]MDZ4196727.1 GTPase Era [Candidatus Izemoplasmatales bacterium]